MTAATSVEASTTTVPDIAFVESDSLGFDEALEVGEDFVVVGLSRHAFDRLLHVRLDGLASGSRSSADDLIGVLGNVPNLNRSHACRIALQRYFASSSPTPRRSGVTEGN